MSRNPNTKLFDEVEDLEREEEQDLLEDEDEDDYWEEEEELPVSTSGGDLLSEFDEKF